MIKISVIMAVYNVELYIKRAIDSILNQTFKDFELICIDDGSTDLSGKICDEYARIDNRVKVYHKTNGGVASARQFGYDVMSGEYCIHCDPDDWFEQTALEELYNKAKETEADIVISDYYKNIEQKQLYKKQKVSLNHNECINNILNNKMCGSLCNKLIKTDIIRKNNIRFIPNINYCEDELVCIRLFVHDLRIDYLPKAFYHYFQRENSIVQKLISTNDMKTRLKVFDIEKSYLNKELFKRGILNNSVRIKYIFLNSLPDYYDFKTLLPLTYKEILSSDAVYWIKIFLILAQLGFFQLTKAILKLKNQKY